MPEYDGLKDVETLKGVMLSDETDLSDLDSAREVSRNMKEAMTTATNAVVNEVTKIKEEALDIERQLSVHDSNVRKQEQVNEGLLSQIQATRDDSIAAKKNMERKRLQLHRVQSDLKIYNELLTKAESKKMKPTLPVENGAMYLMFLTLRSENRVRSQKIVSRCAALCNVDPRAWSAGREGDTSSLAYHIKECNDMTSSLEQVQQDTHTLEAIQKGLGRGSFFQGETSIEAMREVVAEATSNLDDWRRKLTTEEERRLNYDTGVDEFMKEQHTLIEWCRAQRETLAQLPTTENVQEFCSSLQGRIPRMEENLAVLTGMGEDLIPGPQQSLVEKTLVDVNKTWIDLQVYSYEKLRNALLEEHSRCGLKEEAQRFAVWAAENVKNFLDTVEELMRAPEEAPAKATVRPVLDMCKVLQNDFAPHQLIAEHISDFDVRMEVINDHYKYLLKTITSPLTFLCQKLNAFNTGYHRKDEYEEKVRDLHDWVDIMNPTSWTAIQNKLTDVELTIKSELDYEDELSG
eukprot:TRINITY_DN30010_c1_g1_i1.p1 TRINITY_DN30010_c1_g1~~TRINITY_DN30010_c1_g1_i1.p1  ORF type:complete len:518 (+),score=248.37 TRINITY_DN30010_c1_g1_i1:73-1626(+)